MQAVRPSFNEVREIKKGHHALAEQTQDRTASYRANRHMQRFLSDMHGRDVVRSAQESANLRACRDSRDAPAAESMKTAKTAMMPGADVVRVAERLRGEGDRAAAAVSGAPGRTNGKGPIRRASYRRVLCTCTARVQWTNQELQS